MSLLYGRRTPMCCEILQEMERSSGETSQQRFCLRCILKAGWVGWRRGLCKQEVAIAKREATWGFGQSEHTEFQRWQQNRKMWSQKQMLRGKRSLEFIANVGGIRRTLMGGVVVTWWHMVSVDVIPSTVRNQCGSPHWQITLGENKEWLRGF